MKNPALLEKPSLFWKWRSLDDLKSASTFTKANYLNIILLITFVFLALRQVKSKQKAAEKAGYEKRFIKRPEFPPVEEQPEFDWEKTEPIKLRPFKPKYHLTMAESDSTALESLSPSELLLMDKTYRDRIAYRRDIISEHGTHVVAVNDDYIIRPAVVELYQYLMGTYLPLRFPKMFKLHETDYEQGKTFMLENLVTGTIFPANSTPSTPTTRLLETLGRTIDEDFLFLHPEDEEKEDASSEKDPKDQKYILEAYVCCCPSGFDPSEKLGKRLAAIHTPVPGYSQKLEGSMDRFFAKLEVGKYVKRVNWSITTHPELYAAGKGTNHAHEGEVVEELKDEDLNVEKTFLRSERQTLHRLPKSKALVFAFKTYLYPISDIKEEGLGDDLATAIAGLKSGNAPGMHFYKRGAVWGEAVKRYLRS